MSANPRQEKCRIICDVTNTTCLFLHKTPRCVFNYKYQFILCTAWCFCAPIIGIHILYIKMNVCLFVPYTNPHFWTDRNQTLHKTHPWSGRDRSGSHVCVCVGSPCVYIPSSTSSSCFVLSGKCFANGMTTLIHASHMGNYTLHAQGSETLLTFTFRLLKGKQRTSVTFQTDGDIPISLHVFAFQLIVEQDI